MKYLKFSFIFTLIIGFCLILTTCGVTKQEMGVIINLSGKQRMLTQKMSQEILFIAKGIEVEENKEELRKTEILFHDTLIGLFNGDSELGLVKIEVPEIKEQLEEVSCLWKAFRKNVKAVLKEKSVSKDVLDSTAMLNMPLLIAMNKTVTLYKKESGSILEQSMAVTINLAGRQRMLTQKMTKELLLVALNIEQQVNQVRLAGTVFEFEEILEGLLNGNDELGLPKTENKDIRNQLENSVKKKWIEYKPILTKGFIPGSQVSQGDLYTAFKLNLSLLEEMEKAVQMYTNSVK
jgi:hypothetical protein